MNTLVNLIASYLPPIRTYNDLQNNHFDDEEEIDDGSYDHPTTTFSPITLPPPSELVQRHDQTNSRLIDADHTRIKQLETSNKRLREQVFTLQRQLEHIQAKFASTKMELDHQRSTNTLHLSPKYQAQACAASQARADEELRLLDSFLTKTDEYSGQQIIQAVHDLNTEILQLAAAVSDEFLLTRRSPGLWKESHCEFIREAIGDGMLTLLRDGDYEDDPTVVQLAIQAWEVRCCRQVLDSFCAGAPPEVDRFLNVVFRNMQSSGKPFF